MCMLLFLFTFVFAVLHCLLFFFFFKQKTAYEMRISDWSSDVCSSDLGDALPRVRGRRARAQRIAAVARQKRRAAVERRSHGIDHTAQPRAVGPDAGLTRDQFGLRAEADPIQCAERHHERASVAEPDRPAGHGAPVAGLDVAAPAHRQRRPEPADLHHPAEDAGRAEEHTSELQSLMRTSYAA